MPRPSRDRDGPAARLTGGSRMLGRRGSQGATPMTDLLFRDDAYLAEAGGGGDRRGPGGRRARPHAVLRQLRRPARRYRLADASAAGAIAIAGTVHPEGDRARRPALTAAGARAAGPGATVGLRLDWDRRYRLMRMHSALHLLSVVLPYGVTGGRSARTRAGSTSTCRSRREDIAALEARLNALRRGRTSRSPRNGSPRRSSRRGRRWSRR